ncbi:MAG: hypothetical protein R3300_03190 [Candidatus Promineifilaceae bacterium]|nr:hypothetical protein [Candidatus Promineifilaceae bacterium]
MQRMMQAWRKRVAVAGLLLLVAGLVACGGAEESESQTSVEPTATTVAEAADQAEADEPTATAVPPTETPPPPTETPVPTPQPTDTVAAAASDSCLVGSWEIAEFGNYMESVLQGVGNIEFVGQEGAVRFDFGADGQASVTADNFVTSYAGNVAGVTLDVSVSVNGEGAADYTIVDNQIFYSNPIGQGLTFAATLGGNEVFSYQVDNIGELFGMGNVNPDEEPFTFICEGDSLLYTPPVEGAAPVELVRVGS